MCVCVCERVPSGKHVQGRQSLDCKQRAMRVTAVRIFRFIVIYALCDILPFLYKHTHTYILTPHTHETK